MTPAQTSANSRSWLTTVPGTSARQVRSRIIRGSSFIDWVPREIVSSDGSTNHDPSWNGTCNFAAISNLAPAYQPATYL
jgi:hypothetical protein